MGRNYFSGWKKINPSDSVEELIESQLSSTNFVKQSHWRSHTPISKGEYLKNYPDLKVNDTVEFLEDIEKTHKW